MDSNTRPRRGAALLLFLIAGLLAGNAWAHAINGAIYTSLAGGETVNANNYPSKELVYLNGGPTTSQCNAGSLDDGDYYFQVTNPSGSVLLSSDVIDERKFTVTDGVISDYLGATHHTAANTTPCGGISIRLMPYDNTPNNGGVYKVWITRVTDYHEQGGFVGGHIKTDNFRVQANGGTDPDSGSIVAYKFYDANANGAYDLGEIELADWEMTLTSVNQTLNSTKVTGADGTATWTPLALDNDYHVAESMPVQTNWVHSTTIYIGHDGSPQNPAGPLTVLANQTTLVGFGNYCTQPSGGRTLGFWSNKNGQAKMNDHGGAGPELAMLTALNLRDAVGAPYDPNTYNGFRLWLLGANATNMAYMLSAQLAAMALNVEGGFVEGGSLYLPAGMTVNDIISAADASLGLYGNTTSPHGQRATQEQLKNWLDQLNNGAAVVPATPCAFSFP
jgi:hypothetical protein